VMLSGGLDSRLAVKIMQEKGYDVLAVHFNLPFGTGCCDRNCSFNFTQMEGVKLKIFDCSRGKLLKDYLNCIREAKFGTGAGVNPCIDCRIFMFKEVKKFADKEKINLVVTGEVLGQRPMSQMKSSMELIERKSGLTGRIYRALKEYGIHGRRRTKQMELAKKFKIDYPTPAGGCFLCEKELRKRLKYLLSRDLNENEAKLVGLGRHFLIKGCWVVVGRDEKENKIIEFIGKKYTLIISDESSPGPSVVIVDKPKQDVREIVEELILAYSKKGSLKDRKKFEEWRL